MYEAFDNFLETDTWAQRHSLDEERFFRALAPLVRNVDFNPERMGEYMARKTGLAEGSTSDAIDYYVTAAWAVKKFLQANR